MGDDGIVFPLAAERKEERLRDKSREKLNRRDELGHSKLKIGIPIR